MRHGIDCKKVMHLGGGYLHDQDHDAPYNVDGSLYCGRCHFALSDADHKLSPPAAPGEKDRTDDLESIRQHHELLVRMSHLNKNNANWQRIDFLLSALESAEKELAVYKIIPTNRGAGFYADKLRECTAAKLDAEAERDKLKEALKQAEQRVAREIINEAETL